MYWKFETLLRLMEARLGATLTASGAIYALRRQAYYPLAPDTVLDDFVVPMNARNAGYRIVYDPEAIATEVAPRTVGGEFTRRVRLASGSFDALRDFARIRLDGVTVFAFLSHKVCRWIVPFFLITLLVSNVFLRGFIYRIMLMGQILFYIVGGFWFLPSTQDFPCSLCIARLLSFGHESGIPGRILSISKRPKGRHMAAGQFMIEPFHP